MLSVETTGKNVDQAIQNALLELKAPYEDCDIEVLEGGGLFKKAKVRVTISKDAEEKYIRHQEFVAKETETEEVKAPAKEEKAEEPAKEDITIPAEEDVDEVEVIKSTEKQDNISDTEKAKKFIQGILEKTSLTGSVEISENEEEILVNIVDAGDIIGYRGEGLNAIQYLTSVIVSKNNRHAKKVRVDCDNYRARREQSLIALAERLAKKVERTHASVKLEPMSANERRIIHTALSESTTVETMSKGEEPHRYLIIKPKD